MVMEAFIIILLLIIFPLIYYKMAAPFKTDFFGYPLHKKGAASAPLESCNYVPF